MPVILCFSGYTPATSWLPNLGFKPSLGIAGIAFAKTLVYAETDKLPFVVLRVVGWRRGFAEEDGESASV